MHRWIVPLIAIAGLVQPASACSIPVFRYALEHWQPDPFMVAVFHQGELTAEEQTLLEKLQAVDEDGTPAANVMVKSIDVAGETNPGLLKLWKLQETQTLPWVAVHAPARSGPPQRIIGGAFRTDLVDRLLQSPAREELARRLLEGDSVVWVLLESGDSEVDDPAYDMLNAELARLQTTLRLPEIEAADFGELSIVPESLRLAFSAVRLSRDDPSEAAFVSMLLHVDADPSDAESPRKPMAFPLFGRGRVLYSLAGERLERQSIEDACRFLTGACQCTVKVQNPGVDLLMSVDWDRHIQPALPRDESEPPLVGLGEFAENDAGAEPGVAATADAAPVLTQSTAAPDQEPVSAAGAASFPEMDVTTASSPTVNQGLQAASGDDPLIRNALVILGVLASVVVIATLVLLGRAK